MRPAVAGVLGIIGEDIIESIFEYAPRVGVLSCSATAASLSRVALVGYIAWLVSRSVCTASRGKQTL